MANKEASVVSRPIAGAPTTSRGVRDRGHAPTHDAAARARCDGGGDGALANRKRV